MANEEHLAILKKGVEEWNRWREENPDQRPDVSGANLYRAYLRGFNLSNADLRGANLNAANLNGAKLNGADLSDADLHGAILYGATLSDARIMGANLCGVLLTEAVVSGADLSRVDLTSALLTSADLRGADLRGADLSVADLRDANLRDANLRDANLRDTKLRGADLSDAKLSDDASLRGADLSGADLSGFNLSGADLSGADLSGAFLSGVNLNGANLNGANLRDANLRDTKLRGANLSHANLSSANLSNADLSDAQLSDASLYSADLSGASLTKAALRSSNLRGATLSEANLSGADLSDAVFTEEASSGTDLGSFLDLASCDGIDEARFSDPSFLSQYLERAFEFSHRKDTLDAQRWPDFVAHALQRIKALRALYPDSTPPDSLVEAVQTITAELVKYLAAHPKAMYEIEPRQFEELIAEILASYGWEVKLTPPSKDGGFDIYAISPISGRETSSWIIECKKYAAERKVGVDIARALYGVKYDLKVANAMLATTTHFTKGVHDFKASRYDLALRDYEGILEWLNEYRPNPNGRLYIKANRLVMPGEDKDK